MAGSVASIAAWENTLYEADQPIILGRNVLDVVLFAGVKRWNDLGTSTDADETDPDFPADRAFDLHAHSVTRPTSAKTDWYLVLGAQSGTFPAFDSVVILGHNYGSIGGITVTVDIDDNAAFSTPETIATFSPGTSDKRLATFDLDPLAVGTPQRYTGYTHVRVHSSGGAHLPEIGEVYLAHRRQMRYPLRPYDPTREENVSADWESDSGVTARYNFARGRRAPRHTFLANDSNEQGAILDYRADQRGGHKSIFAESPKSDPQGAILVKPPSVFDFPYEGPFVRRWTAEFIESAPLVSLE